MANATLDVTGNFFKLNNPGDPAFNQLLGINDHDIIVGYFGDGSAVFNNGYVLVPNTHYSVENFAGTPPAGHTITQNDFDHAAGFWLDVNRNEHGFVVNLDTTPRHSLKFPRRFLMARSRRR